MRGAKVALMQAACRAALRDKYMWYAKIALDHTLYLCDIEDHAMESMMVYTREQYIHAVRAIGTARLSEAESRPVLAAKLVYGRGSAHLRGVTCYGAWARHENDCPHQWSLTLTGMFRAAIPPTPRELVEICATGEESLLQIACTTLHECAHVLAGHAAGHGANWKAACRRLGLTTALAAGQTYEPEHLDPQVFAAIRSLPVPTDGAPVSFLSGVPTFKGGAGSCTAGIGVRGGKSRGPGSGSRMRKFVCECEVPVIVRAARDELPAHCDHCNSAFKRA